MGFNKTQKENWNKDRLVRFDTIDDFFNQKYGSDYLKEQKEQYEKMKLFENKIKENAGQYFLLELTNKNENNNSFGVGILRGDLCYTLNGKRYGKLFEYGKDMEGFFLNFYNNEIIIRTLKRAYTAGGNISSGDIEFKKIREDFAVKEEHITGTDDLGSKRIIFYLANGIWKNGKFYKNLVNGVTDNNNLLKKTKATNKMAKIFNANHQILNNYLELYLEKSK